MRTKSNGTVYPSIMGVFIAAIVCVTVSILQAESLLVDFSSSSSPVQSGYQGYTASHEQPATFTTQSYSAFGTTVSVTPSWASGAEAAAMQMIDRGAQSYEDATEDLMRDWIGTDTRSAGDPLTLTVSGLPAGTYSWVSYHHDTGTGATVGTFDVTVNDSTTTDIQCTNNSVTTIDGVAKFEATLASNGGDITLTFDNQSYSNPYNEAWFVMNGFELEPDSCHVDVNSRYQTIEGLGGAICFYNNWFTAHPYKQEIFDYAFQGLNLSMLRLGNWWRGTDGQDTTTYEIVAAANQSLGHSVPIMISSWSPPAYLKSNGETGNGGTLIKVGGQYDYAGFADYWYDSIQDYIANGITPTWISIQNEPDWTASYDSCRFNPSEAEWNGNSYASYALAQDAVYNRLQSMITPPKMLGPEVIGLDYGNLQDFMAEMDADSFYGIAHHLYHGSSDGTPDGYNSSFNEATDSRDSLFPGKPIFMTEYGDFNDMIDTANLIHNSLVVEEVSGYNHWCLIWPGEIGLVEIENPWNSGSWISPKGYWLNPSYWSMKHYSYFIEPGFRRVASTSSNSDVLTSAYLSPDELQLVIVFINRSTDTPATMTLDTGSFAYYDSSIYQTDGMNHFASLGPIVGSQLTLPVESITTVYLSNPVYNDPPAAPSGLTATAGDSSISLDWADNTEPDLASYSVYRSTTSGSDYTSIATGVSNSGYVDTSVTNGTTYYYVVTAVDTDANESAYSNEISAMPNDGSIVQLSAADFESDLDGWVNITGADSDDWTRNSGGTTTPNTGPAEGANGSTWYVYLETSPNGANSAGDTAILESPEIKGVQRTLTFYYHMYGSDIGTLNVDVYDGVWHNAVWSLSGQQHTSSSQAYTGANVDLSTYDGPIRIRFRAVAAGGPRGDMALDDIVVTGIIYGDMNGDRIVNVSDLSEFSGYWLQENCDLDLNGDCIITLYEFAKFSRNWLDDSYQ